MAFPGTCCSRLHRINGGRREFWKQSCSSLGQTPEREAPWDWITSKTHRDKATKSLKTRILHSSPMYDVWINHCSAQKLCGDSDPSSLGTGVGEERGVQLGYLTHVLHPGGEGPKKWPSKEAWLKRGLWRWDRDTLGWHLVLQQHLCFFQTPLPPPTLRGMIYDTDLPLADSNQDQYLLRNLDELAAMWKGRFINSLCRKMNGTILESCGARAHQHGLYKHLNHIVSSPKCILILLTERWMDHSCVYAGARLYYSFCPEWYFSCW